MGVRRTCKSASHQSAFNRPGVKRPRWGRLIIPAFGTHVCVCCGVWQAESRRDRNITNVNAVVTVRSLDMLCSLVCSESQHSDQKDNLRDGDGVSYKRSTWPICHCGCEDASKTAPFPWMMLGRLKLCFLLFSCCFVPSVQQLKRSGSYANFGSFQLSELPV